MGRLKQDFRIDTIVPLRTNMDLYADAMGLTRLRDFAWEPYVCPVPTRSAQTVTPKPTCVAKRQRKLAQRKAELPAETRGDLAGVPADAAQIRSTCDLRPAIEERHRQY
jgi:hypothetical protein